MPRRLLFRENHLSNSSNPGTGFRFIGYDGLNFSEMNSSGEILPISGSSSTINVGSGLSLESENVILGGTISKDTTIDGSGDGSGLDFNFKNFKNISMTSSQSTGQSSLGWSVNEVSTKVLVSENLASLEYNNGVTISTVKIDDEQILLQTTDGTENSIKILLVPGSGSVSDGSIDNTFIIKDGKSSKGLVYSGDYSSKFTTHSVVTKGYVDSLSYKYEIGEYVSSEGGVIFHRHLEGKTQSYLVVAINEIDNQASWNNDPSGLSPNALIGASSSWNGLANSLAIVSNLPAPNPTWGASSSAHLALAFTSGGKDDWYLPSIDELSLLWQNRFNVNRTLSGNSSQGTINGSSLIVTGHVFDNYKNSYWSSTEYNTNSALYFSFKNGEVFDLGKLNKMWIRPVRSFKLGN